MIGMIDIPIFIAKNKNDMCPSWKILFMSNAKLMYDDIIVMLKRTDGQKS